MGRLSNQQKRILETVAQSAALLDAAIEEKVNQILSVRLPNPQGASIWRSTPQAPADARKRLPLPELNDALKDYKKLSSSEKAWAGRRTAKFRGMQLAYALEAFNYGYTKIEVAKALGISHSQLSKICRTGGK